MYKFSWEMSIFKSCIYIYARSLYKKEVVTKNSGHFKMGFLRGQLITFYILTMLIIQIQSMVLNRHVKKPGFQPWLRFLPALHGKGICYICYWYFGIKYLFPFILISEDLKNNDIEKIQEVKHAKERVQHFLWSPLFSLKVPIPRISKVPRLQTILA